MSGLLRVLREYADAVESDLQRYYQTDYRDRWRYDHGQRKLTLRRLGVLVRNLPCDSATALADGGNGWRLEHYLLADVFHATAHQPHPALPKPVKGSDLARDKRVREARGRAHKRQQAIDVGEIT